MKINDVTKSEILAVRQTFLRYGRTLSPNQVMHMHGRVNQLQKFTKIIQLLKTKDLVLEQGKNFRFYIKPNIAGKVETGEVLYFYGFDALEPKFIPAKVIAVNAKEKSFQVNKDIPFCFGGHEFYFSVGLYCKDREEAKKQLAEQIKDFFKDNGPKIKKLVGIYKKIKRLES